MQISSVVFTRIEPAYNVISTKSLVNKEIEYFGEMITISALAIPRVVVCVLGNDCGLFAAAVVQV